MFNSSDAGKGETTSKQHDTHCIIMFIWCVAQIEPKAYAKAFEALDLMCVFFLSFLFFSVYT